MYNQQCPFENQMQDLPCMRNIYYPDNIRYEPMPYEQQPEMMYPKTYFIIYPVIVKHCDMYDKMYGINNMPTMVQLKQMMDNIYVEVEVEVEKSISMESRESEDRQFGFGGQPILRDLIGILTLREFFHRRRRPPFHHVY
jgi:hypothetical protein